MTMLEKELEAKLVKAIKARGGYCLKWTSPGTTGLPDRIILLPGGRVAFAELKRPKGSRVGGLQKYWGRVLTGMGFMYRKIFAESEILSLLAELDLKEGRKHDCTV